MFIDYQEDVSDVPESILVIPFVSCIIPLMWTTNTVMWVEEIDQTFYDALWRLRDAYQRLYTDYPLLGNLMPARFVENKLDVKKEAMLLFSGGIDANVTYRRIQDKRPLLFNIQGWYAQRTDASRAADADIRDITTFAGQEGCDFTYAKSNFARLVNFDLFDRKIKPKLGDSWWHGLLHPMAFISIAIPLAYKRGIKNIYIANSFPMGVFELCASQTTTDSEFRFAEKGRCIHDGAELTRQDKVHVIVTYSQKSRKPYPLRVCSFNDINCCECDKCFRTVLELVAEAVDVKDYGFSHERPLKAHWEDAIYRRARFFALDYEEKIFWPDTKAKMKENYDKMTDEQREFVDWFLSFDFHKAKRDNIRRYYRQHFFHIYGHKLKTVGKLVCGGQWHVLTDRIRDCFCDRSN